MDAELIMTVKQMQDHNAWLDMRKQGIGGSDAGVIMGYNPWMSPFKLWMEKTGQVQTEDISGKSSVKAGVYLEPVVAQMFCDETGYKVERRGMMRNKTYKWMQANIDRLIPAKKNNLPEDIGLEIKTTNAFSAHDWDDDEVPDSYFLQCQHYMMVTGLKAWWIAVLIGGQDFRYKLIDRNEAQIKELFDAEKVFWEVNVLRNVAPDIDGSKATKAALDEKYSGGDAEAIDLPNEAGDILTMLDYYKGQEKDAKAKATACENKLKEMMQDHELAWYDGRKITWKSYKGKESIDKDALKKDHPDIAKKYVKTSKPSRKFIVGKKPDEQTNP